MFLMINYWLLFLLPVIIIGRYLSMKEVYILYKKSFSLSSEEDILQELRKKMVVYPKWHAYGLSGVTISSLCILIVKSLGWSFSLISV